MLAFRGDSSFVLHTHVVTMYMCSMQIRCGDLYNDKAIATFNACAVSDQKCVPQKIDRDVFPEPKPEVLDKSFDLSKFQVRLHGFQIWC